MKKEEAKNIMKHLHDNVDKSKRITKQVLIDNLFDQNLCSQNGQIEFYSKKYGKFFLTSNWIGDVPDFYPDVNAVEIYLSKCDNIDMHITSISYLSQLDKFIILSSTNT